MDFFNDEDTVDKVNSFVANYIDVDDDSTEDSDEAESPKVLANELYSNLLKQCERVVRSLKYCEPLLTRIANGDGYGTCLMGLYTLEETWIPNFEAEEDPDDISEVRVFHAVAHFLALLNHVLNPVVKSFQVCCEIIVRIFEALKLFLGTRNNVELLRGWADLYVWSLEHMKRQPFEIKDGDPGFHVCKFMVQFAVHIDVPKLITSFVKKVMTCETEDQTFLLECRALASKLPQGVQDLLATLTVLRRVNSAATQLLNGRNAGSLLEINGLLDRAATAETKTPELHSALGCAKSVPSVKLEYDNMFSNLVEKLDCAQLVEQFDKNMGK